MRPQDDYFKGLDFEKVEIDGQTLYVGEDEVFFRIDQGKSFTAIEFANTEDEAKLGMFDDADLFEFSITGPEEETFKLIREELRKHYSRNPPEPIGAI